MDKELGKIIPYNFRSFMEIGNPSEIFKSLGDAQTPEKIQKIIFQEKVAKDNHLEIFPFIREQEERKQILKKMDEEKFQEEVVKRLRPIEQESFKKGFEEGARIAREEVGRELRIKAGESLDSLKEIMNNFLSMRDNILNKQRDQILTLIKSLVKWVILRELKEDGLYLEKLLEKMFLEIQAQQNFVIQVSKEDYERMPEVIKMLEEKFGEFKNSRVVIDFELPKNAVTIDSENGMIKSTLENQFVVLDQIFGDI